MSGCHRLVLAYEDSVTAERLAEGLTHAGCRSHALRADDVGTLEKLLRDGCDAVLCSAIFDGQQAPRVVKRIQDGAGAPPVIVADDPLTTEVRENAILAGAAACVSLSQPEQVEAAVRRIATSQNTPCPLSKQMRDALVWAHIESAPYAVYICDAAGWVRYANKSACRMLGYTAEEFCTLHSKEFEIVLREEDITTIARRIREGGGFRYESRHRTKQGKTVPVDVYLSLESVGGEDYFVSSVQDTADRTVVECALSHDERRYCSLFNDSPISLWEEDLTSCQEFFDALRARGVTDFLTHFRNHPEDIDECLRRVKVLDVNDASLQLLEADSKEQLLSSLDTFVPSDALDVLCEEFAALAEGQGSFDGQLPHRTLKGKTKLVEVHFRVSPERSGNLRRVVVSLIDITQRYEMERQLREARADLEMRVAKRTQALNEMNTRLLEEIAERRRTEDSLRRSENALKEAQNIALLGNWCYDAGNRMFEFSDEAYRILGYEPDSLKVGVEVFLTLVHPDDRDRVIGVYSALLEGQDPYDFEFCIRRRSGEYRTIHSRCKLMRGADFLGPVRVFGTVQDTTESVSAREHIRRLSQELIRAQENERQRISLDLHDNVAQTLLSVKIASKTLFDDYEEMPEELQRRFESFSKGLQEAINSVRDLSYDLRPPLLEQLGLARSLEIHCREIQDKMGVDIDFVAAGMENLRLDPEVEINLYRLMQEALRNAVKHAGAKNVVVRIVLSSPDILLRVEDDGVGFDLHGRRVKALRERRMGLSSMEERARLIGGTLSVKSMPGKGTKILAEVPVRERHRDR